MILRRLSIFAGSFSLVSALAVVASAELAGRQVVEGVANLVGKSLVSARAEDSVVRYSLLDTTRAYALEKLDESGEREQVARRHAEYFRDVFERAEAEWERRPTAEWLADYARRIHNLRAALDWAFSPEGEASIGVALTAAAVPLWMHLSLLEECRGRVEQALASVAAGASREARREMKLQAAFAASLMYIRGAVPEIGVAWTKALEIAERLDDTEYQLRSLWGLWSFRISGGQFRVALELAQRFLSILANRSAGNDQLIGERMIGVSQHYLGDQISARHHIERVLALYASSATKSHIIRFLIDQRVTTRVFLARVLWLQGFPDQAIQTIERAIEEAHISHHAMSLCYALAQGACPVALWVGDLAAAERYVEMLLDQSDKHALPLWRAWGRSYQAVLVIRQGDIATGLRLLRAGMDELNKSRSTLRILPLLAEMAEALGKSGSLPTGSPRSMRRWPILTGPRNAG